MEIKTHIQKTLQGIGGPGVEREIKMVYFDIHDDRDVLIVRRILNHFNTLEYSELYNYKVGSPKNYLIFKYKEVQQIIDDFELKEYLENELLKNKTSNQRRM